MLALRPNCELCDKDLPPGLTEARICSYECTFCADCAETVLHDVCPNCGGGFAPRPIRPAHQHRPGVCSKQQPAQAERVLTSMSREDIDAFVAQVKKIPAAER